LYRLSGRERVSPMRTHVLSPRRVAVLIAAGSIAFLGTSHLTAPTSHSRVRALAAGVDASRQNANAGIENLPEVCDLRQSAMSISDLVARAGTAADAAAEVTPPSQR